MARKVGFERKDTEPKRSIADSYLDEFRKKRNRDPAATTPQPTPQTPPKKRRNWAVIIFLSVWLTAWTFGILMALGVILSGEGVFFLYIWLAGALAGWVIVVYILIEQIKDKGKQPNT